MARGPGKGKTNNPNGRRKGVANKITQDLREGIKQMLEAQWPDLEETLQRLKQDNPTAYVTAIEKFMGYVVPKKRDITSDDKSIVPSITIIEDRTERKAD